MQYALWTIAVLVVLVVVLQFVWRYASRRWTLPCPSYLSWMVDGSLVDRFAGTEATLARIDLRPGMTVVEIGPGPGRLLLRAARRVLPGGKAIGVELQQGMIDKLQSKLARDDPGNVEIIHADATDAVLPRECADLVYMCTVLGEIPGRAQALANCFDALKPDGRLSITEIIGDPHYVKRATLEELARNAGFEPENYSSTWRMYTANYRKPGQS
jgi:ubiquinone/menaquinone biosynthesis C-methylase UbiE